MNINKISSIAQLISTKNRLKTLNAIFEDNTKTENMNNPNYKGIATVDIINDTRIEKSQTSRYLAELRRYGAIEYRQSGLQYYYKIVDDEVYSLLKYLRQNIH